MGDISFDVIRFRKEGNLASLKLFSGEDNYNKILALV